MLCFVPDSPSCKPALGAKTYQVSGILPSRQEDLHLLTFSWPQDDESSSGQAFAFGLTLEKLSAHTIDEDGKPTFAKHNPMELLRKAGTHSAAPTC